MSLCDIFPDDPSCAADTVDTVDTDPIPDTADKDPEGGSNSKDDDEKDTDVQDGDEEPAADGEGEDDAEPAEKVDISGAAAVATAEWNRVMDLSNLAMLSSSSANMKLFGVALMWALSGFLEGFRWRKDLTVGTTKTEYYAAGKVGTNGTNYWKQTAALRNYVALGAGCVLAFTSLLAALGVAVPINGLAWMFVGLISALAFMVIDIYRLIGYDSYYSDSTSTTAATALAGKSAMSVLLGDALYDAAINAASMVQIYGAMEGFYYGLWNAMSLEDQEKKIEEWEETIGMAAEEVAEERAALSGEASGEEKAEEGEEEEGAEKDAEEEGDAKEGDEEAAEGEADEDEK